MIALVSKLLKVQFFGKLLINIIVEKFEYKCINLAYIYI